MTPFHCTIDYDPIAGNDASAREAAAQGSSALLRRMLETGQHGPMTAEAFTEHMRRLTGPPPSPPAPPRVISRVTVERKTRLQYSIRMLKRASRITGEPIDVIIGPSRVHRLALVRWAMMLALADAGQRISEIARRMRRDVSTVKHGLDKARTLVSSDPVFACLYRDLLAEHVSSGRYHQDLAA